MVGKDTTWCKLDMLPANHRILHFHVCKTLKYIAHTITVVYIYGLFATNGIFFLWLLGCFPKLMFSVVDIQQIVNRNIHLAESNESRHGQRHGKQELMTRKQQSSTTAQLLDLHLISNRLPERSLNDATSPSNCTNLCFSGRFLPQFVTKGVITVYLCCAVS